MKKGGSFKWAVFFALICAVCVAVFLLPRDKGNTAAVILDGEVIRTVDLTAERCVEFTVSSPGGGLNTIRVENGEIAVTDANCPDKLCVKQGGISSAGVPIVCLPHKLSVEIRGEKEIDAVTGK